MTLVDACRTGTLPTPEPPTDGRVARSYRTNELLVQAVLEILERDGHLRPTASQVARRAGVSRRALYVHFETIEELIATAIERRAVEVCTEWEPPPLDAPLVRRVDGFCRQWSRLSEALVPLRRATAVHEPFSPQVGSVRQHTRQWARAVVEQAFEPELDPLPEREREALTRALHHATSWSAWDELRVQGADVEAACEAMRRLIAALLAPGEHAVMAESA
ncbi:MAG TPA: TetR/AcrR family transcriptional regulator [Acidimicrobiales bacterium]|nr:TetR/AcrR family transcriptional regulator [Acidimicrobiales bacterium]